MDSAAIGILGSGTMGIGIAQVAAGAGHRVVIADANPHALVAAQAGLERLLAGLVSKGRMAADAAGAILARISFAAGCADFAGCGLVIEAIIEQHEAKRAAFASLAAVLPRDAVIASNTSSLSITALAGACPQPGRFLGVHFFNPAPLMPLVEIIPGIETDPDVVARTRALVASLGKTVILAKDTPGFIVNRIARPFYGEALRLLDEGIADCPTIDWAMRELGGFRLGPFELMDLIGNDVNYQVTESIFAGFYFEPRFRPSVTQKRLVEAGRLGRKTGIGFYDHRPGALRPEPRRDGELGKRILMRILAMLINEAADALQGGLATRDDIETAMTMGVNYPRGLLRWADDLGIPAVVACLGALQEEYGEDRYRPHVLLKRMARAQATFHG